MSSSLSGLVHDLRTGMRVLYTHPYVAATAILTLGLGIGVNTVVFSWVDSVLLRPIPGAADADRLVALEEVHSSGQTQACAYPDYRDFQRGADLLSGVAAWHLGTFTIGENQNAQRVYGQIVSANFFSVLGIEPVAGRTFTLDEDRDARAAYPYAVISDRLWRTRFQADPSVLGRAVRMNGRGITIIGVAPPKFRGTMTGLALDVWVHLSMIDQMGGVGSWPVNDRNAKPLALLGRLRPGVSVAQANAQVASLARRMAAAYPATHAGITAVALPLWKSHAGAQAALLSPLRILLAIAVLVLLVACANVANLLLARSVSRQKEFATRLALGAGRARLLRQVMVESAVLAAPAIGVALLLMLWFGQALAFLLPPTDLPLAGFVDAEINVRMLAFASAASVIAALLSGIAPALSSSGANLNVALRDGGRGTTAIRSHHARRLLVMAEVALATVATIGAGLFARSFQKVGAIQLGFDSNRVHVAQLFLASAGYSAEMEKRFCRSLRQNLENAPGIEAASYSIEVPLAQGGDEAVQIEGYLPRPGESMVIARNSVGPDYFRLLRIPVVAGSEFTDRNDPQSRRAVVVNETFARQYFPGADPVGRRLRVSLSSTWSTIVGVVKDSKYESPTEQPRPYFYTPFQQAFASGHNNYFFIRTSGNTADALAALRRAIGSIDPTIGIYRLQSLDEHLRVSLYTHYMAAALMGALGLLSLVLAALGLYCVMAYAVSERSQEIGIRMALGATQADVLGMVLKQAMCLALPGLVLGSFAALGAARLVAGMLVGVGAADPIAFGGAAVVLLVVALLASYLPAWRATRVEPVSALRFQ